MSGVASARKSVCWVYSGWHGGSSAAYSTAAANGFRASLGDPHYGGPPAQGAAALASLQ
jgi:hypothetical protein